jgi:hypothetical protein
MTGPIQGQTEVLTGRRMSKPVYLHRIQQRSGSARFGPMLLFAEK